MDVFIGRNLNFAFLVQSRNVHLSAFGTWLVVLGHGAGVAKMIDRCVICRRRDYLIFLLIYAILVFGWWSWVMARVLQRWSIGV
jgi:hypothetical protein